MKTVLGPLICVSLFSNSTPTLNNANQEPIFVKSQTLLETALNRQGARAIGDVYERAYSPSLLSKVQKLQFALPVKNQYKLSECYLYAYVHFIELVMRNTKKNSDTKSISAEYLFARKMYEIIERRIQGYRTDLYFEGGHFFDALYLTEKYGLVPEEVWQPLKTVFQFDYNFLNLFNGDIARGQLSAFDHDIKALDQLRATGHVSESDLNAHINNLRSKYLTPLENMFGALPERFVVNGKTYTPVEYADAFDSSSYTKFLIHFPKDNLDNNLMNESKSRFARHLKDQAEVTHSVEELNSLIQFWSTQVDNNNPTFLNLHWGRTRHGLVIVGYERSRFNNQIIRFKVLNSWGADWSDKGYAWYTPEDIYKNLINSVSVEPVSQKHPPKKSGESAADFFNF